MFVCLFDLHRAPDAESSFNIPMFAHVDATGRLTFCSILEDRNCEDSRLLQSS